MKKGAAALAAAPVSLVTSVLDLVQVQVQVLVLNLVDVLIVAVVLVSFFFRPYANMCSFD